MDGFGEQPQSRAESMKMAGQLALKSKINEGENTEQQLQPREEAIELGEASELQDSSSILSVPWT